MFALNGDEERASCVSPNKAKTVKMRSALMRTITALVQGHFTLSFDNTLYGVILMKHPRIQKIKVNCHEPAMVNLESLSSKIAPGHFHRGLFDLNLQAHIKGPAVAYH